LIREEIFANCWVSRKSVSLLSPTQAGSAVAGRGGGQRPVGLLRSIHALREGGMQRGTLTGFPLAWEKKPADEWRASLDELGSPKNQLEGMRHLRL
jgi:hypothetical protein